jgi:hypothetical protein
MSAAHTPTPWELGGKATIRSAVTPRYVATLENNSERAANAAFIVRAVNNFDSLVAALKEADSWLDAALGMVERGDGPPNWDGIREHRIVIRAALAKAESQS